MTTQNWIVLIIIVGIFIYVRNANNKKRAELQEAYQRALASGDKQAALYAGRAYYSKLRGGKLTIYDEQAITNDLSAMA